MILIIMDSLLIKTQTEAILIEQNFQTIWDIITDLNEFKHIAPTLADSIEYKVSSNEIDKIVDINRGNNMNKFEVVIFETNSFRGVYSLKQNNSQNIPNYIIEIRLLILNNSKCLLSYKHIFLQNMQSKVLDKLGEKKKHVLKTLQDYFK